jgi:hypothetical protein
MPRPSTSNYPSCCSSYRFKQSDSVRCVTILMQLGPRFYKDEALRYTFKQTRYAEIFYDLFLELSDSDFSSTTTMPVQISLNAHTHPSHFYYRYVSSIGARQLGIPGGGIISACAERPGSRSRLLRYATNPTGLANTK